MNFMIAKKTWLVKSYANHIKIAHHQGGTWNKVKYEKAGEA